MLKIIKAQSLLFITYEESTKLLIRMIRLAFPVVISIFAFAAALSPLAETQSVHAAPLARPLVEILSDTVMIVHTNNTTHEMSVFADGRITNQFRTDRGDNQIGSNISATTIAVMFDQHISPTVDVGSQLEFLATTPITLNTTSNIPGFSEDSYVVYASPTLPYQIKQRTLATSTQNSVIMELVIENTSSATPLTGGKLLYMVDIDVGYVAGYDRGTSDSTRRLVYQTDYNVEAQTGYAMGISLLEGDLRGYGILTDAHSNFPDPSLGDAEIRTELVRPLFDPTEVITIPEVPDNLVSWLVADIPDLNPGEGNTLAFGLCARSIGGTNETVTEAAAEAAMLNCFDMIYYPPPTVDFSQANYIVDEGNGTATITVNLSVPSGLTVTVNYTTIPDTATPGLDYTPVSGTLTFTPGLSSQAFDVPITDDSYWEMSETIFLALDNPNNALIGPSNPAMLIIVNDDYPSPSYFSVYLPVLFKNYTLSICQPYFDDFSNPGSGWQILNNQNAQLGYSGGEYFIRNKVSELRVVQAPANFANQYAVEVDARWDSANIGYEYGLLFGQTSFPIPVYRFVVDPINQRYRLKYHNGSSWQCVNGPDPCWTNSSSINPNSASNHLKAECNGTTISLYVNNQLLWQGNGPTSCEGRVGLVTQALSPPAIAYFDNFQVSCLFRTSALGASSDSSELKSSSISTKSIGLGVDW